MQTGLKSYLFTSESVSEGHPDKICDQISDAILDEFLARDPDSRVAVETLATTNKIVLAGEVRGPKEITADAMAEIARNVVRDIGYEQEGFDHRKLDIDVLVHQQSADIAQGVDQAFDSQGEEGAGDQGIMFGYACRETESLMPATLDYAHRILQSLAEFRRGPAAGKLGPDAKCQVTLRYQNGMPVGLENLVLSTQHHPDLTQKDVRDLVVPIITDHFPSDWQYDVESFLINPTGRFVIGGPDGDAGLTGRKIIVDTYGGAAPHGGGAFSGKDPSKVDRSAAYMARYLAKNVVASGLAHKCTLQLSYAIGVAKPLSLYVNLHGTGMIDEQHLVQKLQNMVDLTPSGIRKTLKLNRPIYRPTASYGHFGRTPLENGSFSWEKLDLATALKSLAAA